MKKVLLIVGTVTFSTLPAPMMLEANGQVPQTDNSSLPPAITPPPPSNERPGRQFGGSGSDGANNPQRQEFRQKMMQRFDSNHDGFLNDSERAQMKEAREQRWKNKEGGNGSGLSNQRSSGGQGDKNSDSPQRQEFHQKMMQRFDANHDGQLDDGEKAQMHEFMQQRRMQKNNGSAKQP